MSRSLRRRFAPRIALALAATISPAGAQAQSFEVWLVDQSNSPSLAHGGTVHIYDGAHLMGESAATAAPIGAIDLAGATSALCLASTGANPVRPHMLFFNRRQSHGVLSFVASGHVVIFDAAARTPLACLRASAGAGGARQAHAAFPSPDERFILVANQNGKLLERIDTDYDGNVFALDPAATLNLATCTTPNGVACQDPARRPDNAPICPIVDSTSGLGFVTLRGGGLFVVDPRATPMRILAEYDRDTVHGNGCGGVEAGGGMYVNSGGGTAANLAEFDVYRFPLDGYDPANPPNMPAPRLIFTDDGSGERDSHGMLATRHDHHLWVADRDANVFEVFEIASGAHANTIPLTGAGSDDPAPDLMDVAPSGNRVFVSLRGPNPLTGDPHASTGATPGLMVLQVTEDGGNGVVKSILPVSNMDAGGVERADPHAVRVRRR